MAITNKQLLIICSALLFITFIFGLNFSYDLGFVTAGSNLCNPLDFGINANGEYLCFNSSDLPKSNTPNFNLDFEVIR